MGRYVSLRILNWTTSLNCWKKTKVEKIFSLPSFLLRILPFKCVIFCSHLVHLNNYVDALFFWEKLVSASADSTCFRYFYGPYDGLYLSTYFLTCWYDLPPCILLFLFFSFRRCHFNMREFIPSALYASSLAICLFLLTPRIKTATPASPMLIRGEDVVAVMGVIGERLVVRMRDLPHFFVSDFGQVFHK